MQGAGAGAAPGRSEVRAPESNSTTGSASSVDLLQPVIMTLSSLTEKRSFAARKVDHRAAGGRGNDLVRPFGGKGFVDLEDRSARKVAFPYYSGRKIIKREIPATKKASRNVRVVL